MSLIPSKHPNFLLGGLRQVTLALLAATAFFQSEANANPVSLESIRADLESGENPVRIVGFGDSITGIYFHTGSRRSWPELLKAALLKTYPKAKLEVYNAGVSGDTTNGAVSRLSGSVLSRKPHLVVAMFGMNDVVSVPVETYQANLTSMVESCHEAGAEVLLMTPNSVVDSPERSNEKLEKFGQAALSVAAAKKCLSVNSFPDWKNLFDGNRLEWTLRMNDDIHPNLNGQARFAELVASEIAGKSVTLASVDIAASSAPSPIVAAIRRGEPLTVVAMPPFDELTREAIKGYFPDAEVSVHPWPGASGTTSEDRSATKGFAGQVPGLKPHLIVMTVPAWATQGTEEELLADLRGLLNPCYPFGQGGSRVVAMMPDVVTGSTALKSELEATAMSMFCGRDIDPVNRAQVGTSALNDLLAERIFFNAGQLPPASSAPYLMAPPRPITTYKAQPAVFSGVVWKGSETPKYQWQKDGRNIAGATTDTLTIPKVSKEHEGQYQLFVKNSRGTTTSDAVALVVQAPLGSLSFAELVLEDKPVGFWRFNEDADAQAVRNFGSAGAVADGAYPNDAVKGVEGVSFKSDPSDKAVTLVNQRVVVPYSEAINPAGSFTVEVWTKPIGENQSFQTLLSNRAGGSSGWNLYRNKDAWEFWLSTGSGWTSVSGKSDATPDAWTHLVAVFEADGNSNGGASDGTLSFYVNGRLVGSQPSAHVPNRDRMLSIGQITDNPGGGLQYKGTVDEVALYGQALSASRVRDHYAVGIGSIASPNKK
jgi:acyl-CoA thioesterase-1